MGGMTQQLENVQNPSQRKDYECSKLQEKSQKLQNEVDEMRRQKEIVETQLRQMEQQLLLERNRVEAQKLKPKSWSPVYEGRYCGCAVAVKQIKEDFAPASCLKMFQREIDMASKCRHPCLLQFIGATVDGGFPLLVTELMETSLRRLLVERPLSIGEAFIISLDVARALNYLHQKRPVPMIHRDISSANVLLWRKAGREEGIQEAQWRKGFRLWHCQICGTSHDSNSWMFGVQCTWGAYNDPNSEGIITSGLWAMYTLFWPEKQHQFKGPFN